MALYRNDKNGNVVKVYGPVAEAYAKRDGWSEIKPSAPKPAEDSADITKDQSSGK